MKQSVIFAADIGSDTVKVMVGQAAPDGSLSISGMGTCPTAGFAKGVVTDNRRLAQAIRQAVDCAAEAAGMAGPIYLGISGIFVDFQHCRGSVAPASRQGITAADIENCHGAAVLMGVRPEQRALHTIPLGYRLDGRPESASPLGQQASRLEVDMCAVTADSYILENLLGALQGVGIQPAGILANVITGSRYLAGDEPCLIIDMGDGTTELSSYDGGLKSAAVLPLGGIYITQDIAQALQVNIEQARNIKRYYAGLEDSLRGQNVTLDFGECGVSGVQAEYDFLHTVIESRVEEIVDLIHAEIRAGGFGSIRTVILTGGCARLPSVARRLEAVLSASVCTASLDKISSEYNSPLNTAAYGILRHAAAQQPVRPASGFWQKLKRYI